VGRTYGYAELITHKGYDYTPTEVYLTYKCNPHRSTPVIYLHMCELSGKKLKAAQ